MKSKMKIIVVLIILISIFYPDQRANADVKTYKVAVTIEYNDTQDGVYLHTQLQKEIAAIENCEVMEILVQHEDPVYRELEFEYRAEYKNNKIATKKASVSLYGTYGEGEIDYQVQNELKERDKNIKKVIEIKYNEKKTTYEVIYTLWKDEEAQSLCKTYGVPYTKRDMVAELTPIIVYFQGYRIPYVLEDGGELYIKRDYVDSPLVDNFEQIRDGYFIMDDNYTFRNYNFKSILKNGTKIGKISSPFRHSVYEMLERYTINYEDYVRLSEVLDYVNEDDWRDNKLTYDKASKTLYYGRKPTKKEQSLIKDTIYDFAVKTTKGCKTDKEKVTAIHDAIIKTFQYKSDAIYHDHFTGRDYEDAIVNLDNAVYALKSKKANEEALAILFQECLRRLFIPCQIEAGKYIWPEDAIWNRVYIDSKLYYIDVANDMKGTVSKSNVSHKYFMKSTYYFMGTHRWEAPDYVLEPFDKNWKSIDVNNIKTTQDLRRAVVYASYVCGERHHKTYTFKIKSSQVQLDCAQYVMTYDFVNLAQQEYKNGVLTVTFN